MEKIKNKDMVGLIGYVEKLEKEFRDYINLVNSFIHTQIIFDKKQKLFNDEFDKYCEMQNSINEVNLSCLEKIENKITGEAGSLEKIKSKYQH
jgi:hypothetical protein